MKINKMVLLYLQKRESLTLDDVEILMFKHHTVHTFVLGVFCFQGKKKISSTLHFWATLNRHHHRHRHRLFMY